MKLSAVMERFVLHWGEMGTRWGVSRSVAQVHALLYLADAPLDAEEIAKTLGLARSNVSTSLKELMSWDLVSLVHQRGDRRDRFVAEKDCWTMLRRIADGRKRREVDPTLTMLRACAMEAAEGDTPPAVRARFAEMLSFLEELDGWYRQMAGLPQGALARLIGLGSSILRHVPADVARRSRSRGHG
jgi:DNA-binding transcriptional regulator GbsR (MarR family)